MKSGSAYNRAMCIALPARSTKRIRRSWLPKPVLMVLGGAAFISILSTTYLLNRLSRHL